VHNGAGVAEKKKKRRFVFWWLLLIPAGWFAHVEYNKFHASADQISDKKNVQVEVQNKTTKQPSSSQIIPHNNYPDTKKTSKTANDIPTASQQFSLKNYSRYKVPVNNNTDESSSILQQEKTNAVQSQATEEKQSTGINNSDEDNLNSEDISIQQNNNIDSLNNNNSIQQQKTDAATVTTDPEKKRASSIKKEKSNQHYFYAGLLAGADFSFVKFQQSQNAGYNLGLLVGYKFNKLSIESGILLAKKNYYTDGEYFDKTGISYFDNAKILSVNGYCRMYEIPLNIKYDFSNHKKHTWFATAGLSSYLMDKEMYNYSYIKDGQQHEGSYPYYNTTQDWFSVLNVSAGYQLQIGTKSNFRIEPYYKATLSGVGTGNLSISSIGVNVGIIRKLP
jgi:hypothetical protein